jgi:hypothetical protein
MLTDTQRKYLAELLGECRHETFDKEDYCPHCNNFLPTAPYIMNRTFFTTPQDFFDVVRVLDKSVISKVFYNVGNDCGRLLYFELLQQPDFIERFMVELCQLKGVE